MVTVRLLGSFAVVHTPDREPRELLDLCVDRSSPMPDARCHQLSSRTLVQRQRHGVTNHAARNSTATRLRLPISVRLPGQTTINRVSPGYHGGMAATIDQLLHALTRAVNSLSTAGIKYAVAGGCAVYARGGPMSRHDVDIFVKPEDASRAVQTLARSGLRVCDPPEDWLRKVYDGDILIDVIFRPNNREVTDELLDRASTMRIGPAIAPVVSGTDLMVDKMLVFDAHRLDLSPLLHIARDVREQVDWSQVRAQTAASPYARAFLALLDDLGITDSKKAD